MGHINLDEIFHRHATTHTVDFQGTRYLLPDVPYALMMRLELATPATVTAAMRALLDYVFGTGTFDRWTRGWNDADAQAAGYDSAQALLDAVGTGDADAVAAYDRLCDAGLARAITNQQLVAIVAFVRQGYDAAVLERALAPAGNAPAEAETAAPADTPTPSSTSATAGTRSSRTSGGASDSASTPSETTT